MFAAFVAEEHYNFDAVDLFAPAVTIASSVFSGSIVGSMLMRVIHGAPTSCAHHYGPHGAGSTPGRQRHSQRSGRLEARRT